MGAKAVRAARGVLGAGLGALVLVAGCGPSSVDDAAVAQPALGETSHVVVDADVMDALARDGRVRVVARLEVSGLPAPAERQLRDPAARRRVRDAVRRTTDAVLARLPADVRIERRFELVEALALTIDAAALRGLRQSPEVRAVSLDPGGVGHMTEAGLLVGFGEVERLGYTGAGRRVAVIDSGLRRDHVDFAGRLVDEACFCRGCCPGGGDTQLGAGAAADDHGHGTNVTGIVAGAGTAAPPGGVPAAEIVSVKVIDSTNSYCCASDVVAALDWVLANHAEVDVVNASLGSSTLFSGFCNGATAWVDTMSVAVRSLRSAGILTVSSSGNQRSLTTISAPACLSEAIAVGATWDGDYSGTQSTAFCSDADPRVDQVTCYTNRSTALDFLAPGSRITSAGFGGASATSTFNGTSQAAPQVAACIAAMRQVRPAATAAQLEAALQVSDVTLSVPSVGITRPRLRCDQALASLRCGDGMVDADEDCDDGAANGTTACGCRADCTYARSGTTCGTVSGACDAPDACDGAGTCVARFASSATPCRASAGVCDVEERCTGSSAECPGDVLAGATTVCRASAGACDAEERCTGMDAACPSDAALPDGTSCADGIACNGVDTCVSGSCAPGSAVDCDDGDGCTADACAEPAGTCTNVPIDGCCRADVDCTGSARCEANRCVGGADAGAMTADGGVVRLDAGVVRLDAGASLDGSADGGQSTGEPQGGCGCRAVGAGTGGHVAIVLALLALARLHRRRG